jgi:hypothetical protein
MNIDPKLVFEKYSRVAAISFVVGVGLFSSMHLFAQTTTYPQGALHWNGNTNNSNVSDYTCDSGFSLEGYHYEEGDSNNANWYACVPTNHVPPSCSIHANAVNGRVSWTTVNAGSGTIDQGVGNATPIAGGDWNGTVPYSTTYTMTIIGTNGVTSQCSATTLSKPTQTCKSGCAQN